MSWGAIVVGVVGGIVQLHQSAKNREAAQQLADDAKIKQEEAQKRLQAEKDKYKAMTFTNPYENLQNVYEDLTVNKQQAEFEAQQGAQQRANVLDSLRGAAGGSGIAALAQTMANQGQLQAQRIAAGIGTQEASLQRLAAGEASRLQRLERSGEAAKQQFGFDKQATLLGMEYGEATAANLEQQEMLANQREVDMAAQEANTKALMNVATTAATSDWEGAFGKTGLKEETTTQFTGKDDDYPANPSIGDFAEIDGKMMQYDGTQWVE